MMIVSLVPSEVVDVQSMRKRKREESLSQREELGVSSKKRDIDHGSREKTEKLAACVFSKELTKDRQAKGSIDVSQGEKKHERTCYLGQIVFSDQSFYEGEIKDGRPDGYGVRTCRDGSIYKGHFVKGQPEGFGSLVDFDGIVYQGQFQNGYAHGIGVMISPDDATYEWRFVQGFPRGFGTLARLDGSNYQGNFIKESSRGRNSSFYFIFLEKASKGQRFFFAVDFERTS